MSTIAHLIIPELAVADENAVRSVPGFSQLARGMDNGTMAAARVDVLVGDGEVASKVLAGFNAGLARRGLPTGVPILPHPTSLD